MLVRSSVTTIPIKESYSESRATSRRIEIRQAKYLEKEVYGIVDEAS